jgi:Transposase DDE domain
LHGRNISLNYPMESGMSHQDTDGHTDSAAHHQALKRALDWLLASARLSDLAFREDCSWTPKGLIFLAILWAWSDEKSLIQRFFHARKVVMAMDILSRIPAATYQAFLKMLTTWTVALSMTLFDAFRQRMQSDLAARFEVCGFQVFGVDGSRLELPRTESNEGRFSPAKTRRPSRSKAKARRRARSQASRARRAREKKANSPQMWLTTMFHVGTGLPWDWRLGPSDSSERDHLRQMIGALPAGALITADAGFVGYETWKAILDSGRHLLIRVGANVRLLRKLGYVEEKAGLVYLWPDRQAKRRQPPLVLRMVVARGGRHPVYLVTSVLDETTLSDSQVVEIYALRWGIELFYRHFKQTFERRKLRSHCAANAELEATWSLLGLWAMMLHAQVILMEKGVPPKRISVAGILLGYRRSLRGYKSPPDPGESLYEMVGKAVIDPYKRANKSSRDYPRKKQEQAAGAPKVRNATKAEIHAAKEIRDQLPLRLTA